MKTRRHHNNNGLRRIKRGKTAGQVEAIARRLGLPFRVGETVTIPNAVYWLGPNGLQRITKR